MHIRSVAAGYSDPAMLGQRGELGEVAGDRVSGTTDRPGVSATRPAAVLAEILSKYDVTDISPTEFSEMIQKLHEAGAVSQQELQQLTAIRHDLDVDGFAPDDSVDLLEYYAQKIKKVQQEYSDVDGPQGTQERLSPLLRRLDWIEKFALIQSAPEAVGLDEVA